MTGAALTATELTACTAITARGYTGHSLSAHWRKHLDELTLINMNGRVYDPSLGLFLSPDNQVQDAENSQNYNRYAYCLNNPLMYTDPSGYSWLSQFTGWVGQCFDNLGAWLTKNNISFQVGYSTNSGCLSGGTPFVSGSCNGYSVSAGYNISSNNFGIGANSGGFTDLWYPNNNYGAPEQNALNAIGKVRDTYGEAWRNAEAFGPHEGEGSDGGPFADAQAYLAQFGESLVLCGGGDPNAKYGKIVYGFNLSGTLALISGVTVEFGFVVTDKNYRQFYISFYSSKAIAASASINVGVINQKGEFVPTISNWEGDSWEVGGNYKLFIVQKGGDDAGTYNSYTGGIGPGISFPAKGTGCINDTGKTFLIGSPIEINPPRDFYYDFTVHTLPVPHW